MQDNATAMSDQDSQNDAEIRYSRMNPPPDVESALKQLDSLESTVDRISADLQSYTEDSFETPEDYDFWKVRATRAKNYKLTEIKFIEDWLNTSEQDHRKKNPVILKTNEILREKVAEFLRTATPYDALYNDKNKPSSLKELGERRAKLSVIKLEYSRFLFQLRQRSIAGGCSKRSYQKIISEIALIISRVDAEYSFLKQVRSVFLNQSKKIREGTNDTVDEITVRMRTCRQDMGLTSDEMLKYLFKIISKDPSRLIITREEASTLEKIESYISLLDQREAARNQQTEDESKKKIVAA